MRFQCTESRYAPDGYADRVQRAAVLYPLAGYAQDESAILGRTAGLASGVSPPLPSRLF